MVCAEKENRKRGDTAPVGRKGDDTDKDGDQHFEGSAECFAVVDGKQNQAPRQRPRDARLVKKRFADVDAKAERVGKMRDERERKEACGVFFDVARAVIAFRDKKPHDRRGQPADDVKKDDVPFRRIAGEKRPREVIDGHGKDGDQFELIGGHGCCGRCPQMMSSFAQMMSGVARMM